MFDCMHEMESLDSAYMHILGNLHVGVALPVASLYFIFHALLENCYTPHIQYLAGSPP